MESLARRGVRTTVAVAGLAALGAGLATPAFAAPSVPDVSGVGGNPTNVATDQVAGSSSEFTKASDALAKLPGKFNFAMPAVNSTTVPSDATAAPRTPTPSAQPVAPSLPVGTPNVQANPVSNVDPGSALQALGSAGLFS